MSKKNSAARRMATSAAAALLVFLILQGITGSARADGQEGKRGAGQDSMGSFMLREFAETIKDGIYDAYMLCLSYAAENGRSGWILREQMENLLPLYGYAARTLVEEDKDQELSFREMLLAEAEEGVSPEQELPGQEEEPPLTQLLEEENQALRTPETPERQLFVPHARTEITDLEALRDYETLLRQFYTVDGNTMVGSDQLDLDQFLEKDLTVSKEGEGPQILIFHTHSRESFADSRPGDSADTIVGVGDRLAQVLTDTYGYEVLHHTAAYDAETRDGAYSRALPEIEKILRENPSIQVVIDLHRDEMPEGTRLVVDLDGRPTARFMFFNGLSRTKKTGNIAYLYNENLQDNLAFSFRMQLKAAEYYPGLTRRIYLKGYRYNMHLAEKFLLIELGAQNNTVEEAMNACDPLSHILDLVLSGEV